MSICVYIYINKVFNFSKIGKVTQQIKKDPLGKSWLVHMMDYNRITENYTVIRIFDMKKCSSYIAKFFKITKYVCQFKERTDTRMLTIIYLISLNNEVIFSSSFLCLPSFLHWTSIILVNKCFHNVIFSKTSW